MSTFIDEIKCFAISLVFTFAAMWKSRITLFLQTNWLYGDLKFFYINFAKILKMLYKLQNSNTKCCSKHVLGLSDAFEHFCYI